MVSTQLLSFVPGTKPLIICLPSSLRTYGVGGLHSRPPFIGIRDDKDTSAILRPIGSIAHLQNPSKGLMTRTMTQAPWFIRDYNQYP